MISYLISVSHLSEIEVASSSGSRISAEHLQLYCECELELAKAADARLLSITAARHVFNAMKQIQTASSLEEEEDTAYVLLTKNNSYLQITIKLQLNFMPDQNRMFSSIFAIVTCKGATGCMQTFYFQTYEEIQITLFFDHPSKSSGIRYS